MMANEHAEERRAERTISKGQYKKALTDFQDAMGLDSDTAFEVTVQEDQTVVKHVRYTQQESGTMSGEFWTEIITHENN